MREGLEFTAWLDVSRTTDRRSRFTFYSQFSHSHNKFNAESYSQRPTQRWPVERWIGVGNAPGRCGRTGERAGYAVRAATRPLSGSGVSIFLPGRDVRVVRDGSERAGA